jgi:hypothetical protein
MKQIILFVLAAMSINLTAGDFANLNWGMSRNQVEQAGKATGVKYTKTAQGLEEKTQLAGQPCTCFLYFHEDKFYKAEYLFIFASMTPKNKRFSLYEKFRDLLAKKYGKAALSEKSEFKFLEKEEYYNDSKATSAEKKDRILLGIALGELVVGNYWDLARTHIAITLLSEKKEKYYRQTVMRITYRTKDKKTLSGAKEKAEKSITDRL